MKAYNFLEVILTFIVEFFFDLDIFMRCSGYFFSFFSKGYEESILIESNLV